MRPPSSIEPFTPSAEITLHPTLQAVLDNLDVQIEAELSRYRRQRRNPHAAPRRLATQSATAIGILKQNIQLPQPRASIYANPADALVPPIQPPAEPLAQPPAPQSNPQHPEQVAQSSQQPAPQIAQSLPIQSWTAPATPPDPAPAARATQPAPAHLAPIAPITPEPSAIPSYAEQYDLSAYAPDSVLQQLMQQLEPPQAGSIATTSAASAEAADYTNYKDYLASSEELLRSIAEEETMQRAEQEPNSLLDTLLTPLGIGSMLLLLLSSTTLGYVVMNPSSIGLSTAPPAPTPALTTANSANAPVNAGAALPSPNLAAEEFLDLGLDTLSSIPKPQSGIGAGTRAGARAESQAGAQPSSPKAIARSADPAQPLIVRPEAVTAPTYAEPQTRSEQAAPPIAPAVEPSLATVVVPARPPVVEPVRSAAPEPAAPRAISPEPISVAPPAAIPAPQSPAPTASAQPQSRYYVVTEYTGDPSLREARGAVPDAYVRNIPSEGAKVQLGAFSEQAKAEQLQQELRQQGIAAEVYRP